MVWKYEKFRYDSAIYAFCPNCGFYHNPSELNFSTMTCDVMYQYNYCPICGEYLYNENLEKGIGIIRDERDIMELYK